MVLEATVICCDNSEWMRNGDYAPSRFQAQSDAINLICGAKTQSNPENTVGILTMAGKGAPRVLVTPTADLGKILSTMHGLDLGGETKLLAGLQVAQLALKHRQNKNQRQRIVLFIGSPLHVDTETLVRTGKKLKKNNVALDIVSFGEEEDDKAAKLESLLSAVNSNDNSHLVHVPPAGPALSDVLISSPIFAGDGEAGSGFAAAAAAGAAAAAAAAGGLPSGLGDFDFGVDPNLDPELALALRVSMEEERARQEAAARRAAEEAVAAPEGAAAAPGDSAAAGTGPSAAAEAGGAQEAGAAADPATVEGGAGVETAMIRDLPPDAEAMDEDSALLQQALALSMAEANTAAAAVQNEAEAGPVSANAGAERGSSAAGLLDLNSVLADPTFVNSILASLPGVDPNDPSVKDVLNSLAAESKEENDKKDESGK